MSIIITENKIRNRLQASTRLVQKFNRNINCIRDNTQPNDYVILGSSSSSRNKTKFKIKESLQTKMSFFGSYTEIWKPQSSGSFVLIKIYFHLYSLKENDFEELLALHCDLDADPTKANQRYKVHPHLHVSCAKADFISKAHFSLCLTNYKVAISNLENLERVYRDFFEMISYEVIK